MTDASEKISNYLDNFPLDPKVEKEMIDELQAIILSYASAGGLGGTFNTMRVMLGVCGQLAAATSIILSTDKGDFVGFDLMPSLRFIERCGEMQFSANMKASMAALALKAFEADEKKRS